MTSALWSCAVFSSIMVSLGQVTDGQNDWTNCRPICKCKWVSGKKTAECLNADLTAIPRDLSPELQTVDLSGNNIRVIGNEAFRSVGLINLHKIYLKECGIEILDKDSFRGLQILIELYLSDNKIHTLHSGTFKDNLRLRVLFFNKNPIQILEDDLFSDLQFLQTVEMSGCNLSQISIKSFFNVPNLQHLALDGNNLSFIKLAAVEHLVKLRSLVLHNNPWRCDCHLRSFREWIMGHNLFSLPTACSEPFHLQNRFWNEIPSNEYACKPNILWPNVGTTVTAESEEITLSCQVSGDPAPEVYWVFNSKIIPNNWRATYGDQRYSVKSYGSEEKWVNLTINKVQSQDRGEFTCVAKNPGGVDERNLTLLIKSEGATYDTGITTNDSWPLTIGLITGCIALFILITIFCCCCCHNRSRKNKKKASGKISSNTDISSTKNSSAEQEKRLLTIVNPADKIPPSHPPTEGTGLLVLKKILNDETNTLISSGGGDVEKSMETLPHMTPRIRSEKIDAYPPDLIAFQGRTSNASPTAVSTSNILDSSRIRSHVGSQSPMTNSMMHCFGTLPYSRSESPFSPVAPIVLPRQGYVTIPRRPRVPSWSSAPTPTLLDERLSPLKAEPVYDNLGPRTTVDGSSVLSLNKDLGNDTLRKLGAMSPHNFHLEKRDNAAGHLIPAHIPHNESPNVLKRVASAEGNFNAGEFTPLTPKSKVTPKPTPKSNKNVTLYEDETEDGTEV